MIKNKILLPISIFVFLVSQSYSAFSFSFFSKKDPQIQEENKQDIIDSNQISDPKLTINEIDQSNFTGTAILQCLNKVTAKSSNLEALVGKEINFDTLTIKVDKCWRAPSDQRPENKILLEVTEALTDGTKKPIFYGWMFSSSPSISGLEHPVYDITAIECKK